ncbi:unnamed protein product [Amoebophrya sp. A25]|nr:unnamed protein product [Amoebophrya sp. A25]|eukprot:GSA25T00015805001.1
MGNAESVLGNLEYLFGIWVLRDDAIGKPIVFRFCGANNRQCFTMSYISTQIFGVPGKIYAQVEGYNFGIRGEYTLMRDGLYVEIQDIEGDPMPEDDIPDVSMVSLWQKGMVLVFEVSHASDDRVTVIVRNVIVKRTKNEDGTEFIPLDEEKKRPVPEAIPTEGWQMRWNGDQPYLQRPFSSAKREAERASRNSLRRVSVKRESHMKPGDKGRIALPDGRAVEYTVPPGDESHFIVAF